MEVLHGTPYPLEPHSGPLILGAARELTADVAALRDGGQLDEPTLKALRVEWRLVQVYESAGIEGNLLSLGETELAIQRGMTIAGKPAGHSEEVRNLAQAHDKLEELARADSPLEEADILSVHSLVLGADDRRGGHYRVNEVRISGARHRPPHPDEIGEQIKTFYRWLASAGAAPLPLLAAVAHAWLAHIHPFVDGNGRTARAIMNLVLMRQGFPIAVIRRKDRRRYYEGLAASDEGDIGPFLELILDRSRDSLQQIDRVQTEETGVSMALAKIQAADRRRMETWNTAMDLLCQELASGAEAIVERDSRFRFAWKSYDRLDLEDFLKLCSRKAVSKSWIAVFELSRGDRRVEFLLWAGFLPPGLMGALPSGVSVPWLRVSEPNPKGYPRWKDASEDFPMPLREVTYSGGSFYYRLAPDGKVTEEPSGAVIAKRVLAKTLEGAFLG